MDSTINVVKKHSISINSGVNKFVCRNIPEYSAFKFLKFRHGTTYSIDYKYLLKNNLYLKSGIHFYNYASFQDSVLWDYLDPYMKPKGYIEAKENFLHIAFGLGLRYPVHKRLTFYGECYLSLGRFYRRVSDCYYYDNWSSVRDDYTFTDSNLREWTVTVSINTGFNYFIYKNLSINACLDFLETIKVIYTAPTLADIRHYGGKLGLSISF
jgi:hypothetical protein